MTLTYYFYWSKLLCKLCKRLFTNNKLQDNKIESYWHS